MGRLFEDLAAGDVIITGERDIIDAPRTERGRRQQAMAEWRARQPTEEDLKNFCPHDCYLPIETCDEGCQ